MDRDGLKTRVAPLELYKCTPRNNCGECGRKTCLAFATMVVTGQEKICACPFLEEEKVKPLRDRLEEQLRSGVGVSREGFEKTMEFLTGEIEKCDFAVKAESLGAGFYRCSTSSRFFLRANRLQTALAEKFRYLSDNSADRPCPHYL